LPRPRIDKPVGWLAMKVVALVEEATHGDAVWCLLWKDGPVREVAHPNSVRQIRAYVRSWLVFGQDL